MTESHHPEMSEQYKIDLTHLFLNLVRNLYQFGPLNRCNNQNLVWGKKQTTYYKSAEIQNVFVKPAESA